MEESDSEREVRPADEDEQGGEVKDFDTSSGGGGFTVCVDRVLPRPAPWEVDRLDGLEAGGEGLF